MKTKNIPICCFSVLSLIFANSVEAAFIFGAGSNGGLYSIDTTTGTSALHATVSSAPSGVNSLAFNHGNSSLVFGIQANNNWNIYSRPVTFAVGGNAVATVGSLNTTVTSNIRGDFGSLWPGGSNNRTFDMTGGAAYANGKYYFIPDRAQTTIASPSALLSINLSSSNALSGAASLPLSQNLGDFGDLVVLDQTAYFLSTAGFGRINLTNGSVTVLNASLDRSQLAFDGAGQLWANLTSTGLSTTSKIAQINLTTGAIIKTVDVIGNVPSGWNDLANGNIGGIFVIPEPSSLLLSLFGSLTLFKRRRGN